jgi:hypothetical protein
MRLIEQPRSAFGSSSRESSSNCRSGGMNGLVGGINTPKNVAVGASCESAV